MEPVCIQVSPTSVNEGMTITYTITGMNEDMVTFTARQNGETIYTVTNQRDHQALLNNRGNTNVEMCW